MIVSNECILDNSKKDLSKYGTGLSKYIKPIINTDATKSNTLYRSYRNI